MLKLKESKTYMKKRKNKELHFEKQTQKKIKKFYLWNQEGTLKKNLDDGGLQLATTSVSDYIYKGILMRWWRRIIKTHVTYFARQSCSHGQDN